ncbi:MAG TPA: hypothetical protein VG053_05630 [Solirubrobacteraceae bacterium]|nr:hypothetical protein [Solirubrobacteraceae bacterium]
MLAFLLMRESSPQSDLGPLLTSTLPQFQVDYPKSLTPESPPADDHIAFLAEKKGPQGRPGTTLVVRQAAHATADLTTDVSLLNDLESFQNPGRRLIAKRAVAVPGAASAFIVDAEYPDMALGGPLIRHVDLVVRGPSGASYHLVFAGAADAFTNSAVEQVVGGFKLSSQAPAGEDDAGP